MVFNRNLGVHSPTLISISLDGGVSFLPSYSPATFSYLPLPTLASVRPAKVPYLAVASGEVRGVVVTILGSNFARSAELACRTVGNGSHVGATCAVVDACPADVNNVSSITPIVINAPGQAPTVISPRDECMFLHVTLLHPPALSAQLQIQVSFDGQAWLVAPDTISYYTINSVQPSRGPVSGGTIFSINGVNLGPMNGEASAYRCRLSSPYATIINTATLISIDDHKKTGQMACRLPDNTLQGSGAHASSSSGRYVLEISGPGGNADGWTSSNLTVVLYPDLKVERLQPSMVSNTRASLITVLGANFLQGLVCRFLAKHAAAPPATNASAHPQLLAGAATLINNTALVCRVPPLPDDSIGIYLLQLSANEQQWTTGKTRCFAGGAAGASNTSANSSTVNGTNSTSSLEPCSEDGRSLGEYLTVYSVPRVSRIFPSTGPSRGSLPISVHGVQFQQFTAMPALKCVYNQSSQAPQIISAARVVSDSLIVCSPLGHFLSASVTRHSVQITPDDDIFSQASMEFAYYGAEAVFPRSVPETGGFQVTVAGVHFTGATPNGVACRFSALNASAGGYMHTLVQGGIVQILARDAGNEFIKMSAVVCTTPDAASLAIRSGGSNVTLDVSLHGDQGFTSNNLTLTLYPLPRLFAAHPSFSSTGGGVTVTVIGSGFLATAHRGSGVRCRFTRAHMHGWGAPVPATVLSDTHILCNSSRLCSAPSSDQPSRPAHIIAGGGLWPFMASAAATYEQYLESFSEYADSSEGRCDNEGLQPHQLMGSVDVALNGQHFTTNGSTNVSFTYYYASRVEPSGGALQGGTTVTVFGANLNVSASSHKCRFSHNMHEVAGVFRGEQGGGIVCTAPQGRAYSTVQVCAGSPFSATDPSTVGCAHGWTANGVLYFHYSLYPLVFMRPASGPAVGGSEVVIYLAKSQYQPGSTSGQQFRSYSRAGALCRFGAHAVAATVVNTTRLLCVTPSHVLAQAPAGMIVDVSVSLNGGQDFSRSPLAFSYHIVTSVSPMMRPSRCTAPDCIRYVGNSGNVLTCDWCTEYPRVDSQRGWCRAWDAIYVKGIQAQPLSITVRGINLMSGASSLAEGGTCPAIAGAYGVLVLRANTAPRCPLSPSDYSPSRVRARFPADSLRDLQAWRVLAADSER